MHPIINLMYYLNIAVFVVFDEILRYIPCDQKSIHTRSTSSHIFRSGIFNGEKVQQLIGSISFSQCERRVENRDSNKQ